MSGQTTDPGNRSSAEIERDVERSRARLAGTLEELRDRTSPGQLFEQALDYARNSGGSDFARNLGQSVRDNPLPVLLIGAGIGWLMLSGNGSGRGMAGPSRTTDGGFGQGHAGVAAPHAGVAAPALGDSLAAAGGEVRDSLAGVAGQVGQAASAAYHRVADATGSLADSVGSGVAATARGLSHASHDARDRLGEAGSAIGEGSRRGLDWALHEQPLVLGALGLAVGAALGALLPRTETEDRLMGETRDDLVARATDTVEEGYRQVRDVAAEKLDETTERLDRAGLSPQRAADSLGETARQLREAASETTRDVAGRAREAVESTPPPEVPPEGRTPGRPTPAA